MTRLLQRYTFVDYLTQLYLLVVAVLILCFHNGTVQNWAWLFAAHLAAMLALHGLLAWQGRRPANTLLDFLRHFYPVLCFLWFFAETGWLNRMFVSDYLDPLAIHWDQKIFGCQPAVLFMHKLPYLLVSEIFYGSYFSYYLMIFGVGLALYLRKRSQFYHYISVVCFVFYPCYLCYIFLPVIGPRVFFRDVATYTLPPEVQQLAVVDNYPAAIAAGPFYQTVAFIYRVFEAPGAAFPSSHVAIALTTLYFSFRYLRPIRYVHLVLAILLCLATIYCRYHYAIDVAAGMLTAAVLVPLGNWFYFRFATAPSAGKACS